MGWAAHLRLQAAVAVVVTLEFFLINAIVSNYFCKCILFPNLFLTCSELALAARQGSLLCESVFPSKNYSDLQNHPFDSEIMYKRSSKEKL